MADCLKSNLSVQEPVYCEDASGNVIPDSAMYSWMAVRAAGPNVLKDTTLCGITEVLGDLKMGSQELVLDINNDYTFPNLNTNPYPPFIPAGGSDYPNYQDGTNYYAINNQQNEEDTYYKNYRFSPEGGVGGTATILNTCVTPNINASKYTDLYGASLPLLSTIPYSQTNVYRVTPTIVNTSGLSLLVNLNLSCSTFASFDDADVIGGFCPYELGIGDIGTTNIDLSETTPVNMITEQFISGSPAASTTPDMVPTSTQAATAPTQVLLQGSYILPPDHKVTLLFKKGLTTSTPPNANPATLNIWITDLVFVAEILEIYPNSGTVPEQCDTQPPPP
jgi:hypothetical protein